MLIELSDELASPGSLDPAMWRHALANLALGHYEGKHFVFGSPRLLAKLCGAESLDAAVRGRFKEIRERVNDAHGLRGEARVLLRVHASDSVKVTAEENAKRTTFNVGLLWFVDSARAQATRLLAENPKDTELYALGAQALVAHQKHQKHRGVEVKLRLAGGGGGTTDSQLRLLAPEGALLCVVDSDRSHADASPGDTARAARVALVDVRAAGHLAAVELLVCRTIENMLPTTLVLEGLPRTMSASERARYLDAAKQGMLGGGGFENLKSVCGDKMLATTLARAKEMSVHDLGKHLFASHAVKPLWLDLGERLTHWGLAPKASHV